MCITIHYGNFANWVEKGYLVEEKMKFIEYKLAFTTIGSNVNIDWNVYKIAHAKNE